MEAHLGGEEQDDLEVVLHLFNLSLPLSLFLDSVFAPYSGGRGRKKKYDHNQLAILTTNAPLNERGTYRNHAAQIGVS